MQYDGSIKKLYKLFEQEICTWRGNGELMLYEHKNTE